MGVKGKMIVFSAPSGSGKTTIVRDLLTKDELKLEFSISAASRAPRGAEVNGKDYHFMSVEDFKSNIDKDSFLEWEEVYPDNFYGTLKSEVERIWNDGKHVIFDIDVVGGLNIKKQFPEETLAVFVMPPSVEELRNRLTARDTETPEKIEMRVAKAEAELKFADEFDIVLLNRDLEVAKAEAYQNVMTFINK
jgi:guanylate kinase